MEKFLCKMNTEYFVDNYTCGTVVMNKTTTALNLETFARADKSLDYLLMKISFLVKKPREKEFKPFWGISNVTFDYCQVMSGRIESTFFQIITAGIGGYSNVLHPCPFTVR